VCGELVSFSLAQAASRMDDETGFGTPRKRKSKKKARRKSAPDGSD
jgi:hypothetical protein